MEQRLRPAANLSSHKKNANARIARVGVSLFTIIKNYCTMKLVVALAETPPVLALPFPW